MDELIEGAKVLYALSEQDATAINQQIAKYPDRQPVGTTVDVGQRVNATVVLSHGPNHEGAERLAVQLDGTTPTEKSYHVWAADLRYDDGAWHKTENSE